MPHWPQFQTHLACNLWVQCQAEKDEEKCDYTRCGPSGGFLLNDKCYILGSELTYVVTDAKKSCGAVGGRLVNLKLEEDMKYVSRFLWRRSVFAFHIGLTTSIPGFPSM